MMQRSRTVDRGEGSGVLSAALWLALALVACLSVVLINGRPLFYFDTVGYIDQGQSVLRQVGLLAEAPPPAAGTVAATVAEDQGAAGVAPLPEPGAKTVDGSRSIFYSVLSGALAAMGVLEALNLLHAVSVIVALWLPMNVAARLYAEPFPVPVLIAIPVLAATLGSMPFIVAHLMPDVFAPVMILVIATITAFGRDMRAWELLLAFALGSLAVVSHLSHLAIAAAMVPAVFLVGLFLGRGTWWFAPLFAGALVVVGFAQQLTVRTAAEQVGDSEVIIRPFLTARLIEDGPGYDYLESKCPDPGVATCALYDALQKSDDPMRLTASHILFQRSEQLGSLQRMPEDAQLGVAHEQVAFFVDVLRDRPLETVMAFVNNTLEQSTLFSVEMTLPTDSIIARHEGVEALLTGPFAHGRITADDSWEDGLTDVQSVYYAICLIVVLALIVRPAGSSARRARSASRCARSRSRCCSAFSQMPSSAAVSRSPPCAMARG